MIINDKKVYWTFFVDKRLSPLVQKFFVNFTVIHLDCRRSEIYRSCTCRQYYLNVRRIYGSKIG